MDRWNDFPIEERGANGSQYKFNPSDVLQFISNKRDEERKKTEERDEGLASLQLAFDDLFSDERDTEPADSHSTIKRNIDAWKLRELKRKEAERCGKLVIAEELSDKLMDVFTRLSAETHNFWKRACLRNGIPEPITQRMLDDFATVQRTVVSELTQSLLHTDNEQERHIDFS